MGRPIKKKYFGNTNIADTGEGVGGEGIASIVVTNGGTLYSQATTLSLSAPQIAGGQQATIDYSISYSIWNGWCYFRTPNALSTNVCFIIIRSRWVNLDYAYPGIFVLYPCCGSHKLFPIVSWINSFTGVSGIFSSGNNRY